MQFIPMDALMLVNAHEDLVHVSTSADWLAARQDSPHLNKIIHPYDWTFTTQYKGEMLYVTCLVMLHTIVTCQHMFTLVTWEYYLLGTVSDKFIVEPSDLKINYGKLKIQEKILFFDDVVLFEDELDDNGCAKLSVKLRVMPSGFFVLMRYYLRVDKTLIRVYDTRLYYEVENEFILREYSEREEAVDKLTVGREVWTDQNEIVEHLTVKKTVMEKLFFSS